MSKVWLDQYAEHIKSEIEIPTMSVTDMFQEKTSIYKNHKAISFYGKEYTYKEIGTQSASLASGLQEEGIKKGDCVGLMLPNCPEYVISYYGIIQAGGIVVQINPMLVGQGLEHILKDSGVDTLLIYEPLLPVLNQVLENLNIKKIIKVNFEETKNEKIIDFKQFIERLKKSPEPVDIDPDNDIAVLQYTGGTTGRAKGAMLTHFNILANIIQTYEYLQDEIILGEDSYLTVIPLFHVFGMTACMNLSIYTGAMSIMLPKFEVEEVLQTIKDLKPTMFPGVPTIYIALTNHPKTENYNLDSIRLCNSGSAPMPVELLKRFEKKTGATIVEGYGLSESSPITHCNPIFSKRKPGSIGIGIGIPSTTYKVVDLENGTKELPPDEAGELIIKGPQVMKGYWNMPEETEQTLRNGWLYTGDIASVDKEGYVYIVDRKKDLIIASGYNIYPRDVEEILYQHSAIKEAVVVGIPDSYRGEIVKAVVVLKEGKTCSESELINYCEFNMAAYKVSHIIEFREELPKSNVGKVLRRKVREENA